MITEEPSQGSAATNSAALLSSPSLAQLPERHTSEYRFRNTVAFWIAISFVEGSLLFLCGAVVSMCALGDEWMRRGLVEYAYFAGSLFFSLGAYLGFFQVINVGNATTRLVGCGGTSVEAYWGSLLYFLGALCFNVACAVGLLPPAAHTDALAWAAYWTPSTLGSICFVLAAIIEFRHNSHVRCSTPVFWLCFWYLAGSLLFLVAAAAGWPHQPVEDVVNLPYALGSIAFALGAWCALWMWKAEQFGLGFIREINERGFREISEGDKTTRGAGFYESPYDDVRPWRSTRSAPERRSAASLISVEGGGAGAEDSTNARRMPSSASDADAKPAKVDLKQQAFLLVYVLLGTLSVLNLCTTIACEQEAASSSGHAELGAARLAAAGTILASLSVFFAAHVILMLATVVHRTPSLHPYDYLLWCMRFGALLFFAAEATRFASVLGRFEGG